MSSRFLCRIHNVEYECKAADDCTKEIKELCQIPRCPVCAWKEYRQLVDQRDALTKQRDCLLLAIELKHQHLITKISD